MISAIQDETVRRIFSARIKSEAEVKRERVAEGIVATTAGDGSVKKQPRKVQKIGRNDPCPCGSGKSISSAADGNGRSLLIRGIRAVAAPAASELPSGIFALRGGAENKQCCGR
ncbi:MAG: SEC-C metal-binding domain-containing protein [Oscillospiraceae bacterium]